MQIEATVDPTSLRCVADIEHDASRTVMFVPSAIFWLSALYGSGTDEYA